MKQGRTKSKDRLSLKEQKSIRIKSKESRNRCERNKEELKVNMDNH